jgi:hypothetical protein
MCVTGGGGSVGKAYGILRIQASFAGQPPPPPVRITYKYQKEKNIIFSTTARTFDYCFLIQLFVQSWE